MLKGHLVFAQLTAHLPRNVFNNAVSCYAGGYPTLTFSHWDQFLCMSFAQLTFRTSLRDITTCLRSHASKLYFAGFRGTIARSTLADANEKRDCRIFEAFALEMIGVARRLYAHDSMSVQLKQSVYAIDSTTVDLCLSLFEWAPAANARAGVKMHTVLDLRGNIPSFIRITDALISDASFLDHLRLEAGSFYIMDRGYMHFARLAKFAQAAAFFVVRSKQVLHHRVIGDTPIDAAGGVMHDQHILLTGRYTKLDYPLPLRRVEVHDPKRNRTLILLTNNFELSASQISGLYKSRWQVELFFKWIKQHLRIKTFFGRSPNAVKTQIWTAVCTYVLVAIVKKRLNAKASMNALLQVLSLNLFEKVSLEELFHQTATFDEVEPDLAQLELFQ